MSSDLALLGLLVLLDGSLNLFFEIVGLHFGQRKREMLYELFAVSLFVKTHGVSWLLEPSKARRPMREGKASGHQAAQSG